MKDDLKGRVVGFVSTYTLDPSQLEEGDSPVAERIDWLRIESIYGDEDDPTVVGRCVFTGQQLYASLNALYVTMPADFNSDLKPVVGYFVDLAYEDDCIVPAGRYRVSKVNPDGSFHVGGKTAVWPRRITARYPQLV